MTDLRRLFSNFYRTYPLILDGIISFGDIVQALIQTVIISFGLPAILLVLLAVEHQGIYDGLSWFMADKAGWWAAFAVVMANFVIEFTITHVESSTNYREAKTYDWSIALWARGITYRLGINKQWKPRPKSPAHRFYSMRQLLTVMIFVVALSGRMRVSINKVSLVNGEPVPLSQGLTLLETQSTLADLVTWMGGTLFTMVALISVQGLTNYVAVRVIDIRAEMKKRLTQLKASATRERNSERFQASYVTHDAYVVDKLRDNVIKPIRVGERYKCPKCGKEMSRQAWSKHPCRFEIDKVALSQFAVDAVDKQLTPQPSQLEVNLSTVGQLHVNGNGNHREDN